MAILAYGVNYRTATIDVRERVAFTEEGLEAALADATMAIPSVSEIAIISTCNRTELIVSLDPAQEESVSRWLASYRPVAVNELTSTAYAHWDQDAARHLIRVAASDSSHWWWTVAAFPPKARHLSPSFYSLTTMAWWRSRGFLAPVSRMGWRITGSGLEEGWPAAVSASSREPGKTRRTSPGRFFESSILRS